MSYKAISIVFPLVMLLMLGIFVKWDVSLWYLLIPFLIYVSVLVLGAIYIQWNLYIKSVNSVADFKPYMLLDESKKNICLTFDDGIHAENTPRTLDILKQKNIPAHFFIIGKNIRGNEAVLQRMHAEGHVIGNHSFTHSWNFDMQRSALMHKELEDTGRMLASVTGEKPRLFRPPFGVTNPNLARAVSKSKLLSMGWNLRSFDTVARSGTALLNKLISETRPGVVVLLHERCDVTVDVLTDYIDYCLREGYTFVTLKTKNEV